MHLRSYQIGKYAWGSFMSTTKTAGTCTSQIRSCMQPYHPYIIMLITSKLNPRICAHVHSTIEIQLVDLKVTSYPSSSHNILLYQTASIFMT